MGYKKALEALKRGEALSYREPSAKLGKQPAEVGTGQETPAQIGETEVETTKGSTSNKDGVEGNPRGYAAGLATPDSVLLSVRNVPDELETEKANLAAVAILPFSLLGSKKAWVWVIVLVFIAIAGYLLYEWRKEERENISPPKHEPQSVNEFMNKRYRNESHQS